MANKTINLNLQIANAVNRAVNKKLAKIAEDSRRAVGFAAFKGKEAMRDRILDSSTGSKWHEMINKMRGNAPGARYETGTMFNSVTMTRGKIIESNDRRRKGKVTASFGWPANANGEIKDAPMNPIGGTPTDKVGFRSGWRTDPKYFKMQEFGYSLYNVDYPGMYSQQAGVEAAGKALNEFLKARGYK